MLLVDFIRLLLLFLPGSLVLLVLLKSDARTNIVETILYGAVLWNFIFVSGGLFAGSFNLLSLWFTIFTVISIWTIFITLAIIIMFKNRSRSLIEVSKMKKRRISLSILLGLLLLISFCTLEISFHSFFVEWDAILYYIPSALSMAASGGLNEMPYRMLGYLTSPPAVPLIYAWLLSTSSMDALYYVPIMYFLLSLLSLYLIEKEIFNGFSGLIPMIFSSIPAVMLTISSRALYLDIPFVTFMLTSLYSLLRMHKQHVPIHVFLFFTCLTLMSLTRDKFAFLLIPSIIAVFIYTLKQKHSGIFIPLTFSLGYVVREIRNILLDPPDWLYYIQRTTPAILTSILILLLLKRLPQRYEGSRFCKIRNFKIVVALILLAISPAIFYYFRNIIMYGFLIPGLPVLKVPAAEIIYNASVFYYSAFGQIKSVFPLEILLNLSTWQNLLETWWLLPPYYIPILLGLIGLLRTLLGRNGNSYPVGLIILLFFLGCFNLWLAILINSPDVSAFQPRRMYYFAPFVAILVAYGLNVGNKCLPSPDFQTRATIYVISLIPMFLNFFNIRNVNDVALLYDKLLHGPRPDPTFFISFSNLIFLILFFVYPYIQTFNVKIKFKIRKLTVERAFSSTFLILVLVCLLLYLGIINLQMTINSYNGRFEYYGGWYYYPDVVNYFNKLLNDGTVLCFYCSDLIVFSNRTVIDLANPVNSAPLLSAFSTLSKEKILHEMRNLKIKYFIKPTPNNRFSYHYQKLLNYNITFRYVFEENPNFRPLREFKHGTLYVYSRCNVTTSGIFLS